MAGNQPNAVGKSCIFTSYGYKSNKMASYYLMNIYLAAESPF